MKKTILIVLMLFIPCVCFAQTGPIKRDLVEQSNKMLIGVYNAIVEEKSKYFELENFDLKALGKNKHGIYQIDYLYRNEKLNKKVRDYSFGLTVNKIKESSVFDEKLGVFKYSFPLLDLKIVGYQNLALPTKQFNMKKIIKQYAQELSEEQQNYLPFQISLATSKDEYQTDEDIEFSVTLTNNSNKGLRVKKLSLKTLYFEYNDEIYGTTELSGKDQNSIENVILKRGQSITKRFRGAGFSKPRTFDIYCSYLMTHKGVKPTKVLKVRVVK